MKPLRPLLAAALLCVGPAAADAPAPAADVVILGEVHGHPDHHAHQAAVTRAVQPAAIVFEMLLPEQAARVTPDLRQDATALGAALGWEARGWPDFALYHPIFTAAPAAAIVGGDLPRDTVRRAVAEGAEAVFGAGAARFGLDQPLPPAQQEARETLQARAHCDALPEEMLPGMVEAQRLRDATLADAVIRAYFDHGGPVVLITGSGHARTDWGVPALLALAAPELTVHATGQIEGTGSPDAPFDKLRVSTPMDRPDPCAAFAN